MKVSVLISCMHQKDFSIIEKSNIQSDAVVINQCDKNLIEEYTFFNKKGEKCTAKFISTKDRGLSKSRNLAIKYSNGDICLICDDDEILEDNYVDIINNAFINNEENILAFRLNHPTRKFKNHSYRIGFFKVGTIGSWQLAFRRCAVIDNHIKFDEKMGSGTGNGAGEENKFVMDCYKKRLGIRYIPETIGSLVPTGESQWFSGYDEKYWVNRGWQAKKIFGLFFGYLYIWYNLFKSRRDNINKKHEILRWMHKGYLLKR